MTAASQTQLIVDFPSEKEQPVRKHMKAVRFSETSSMKLMRYPTKEENARKWHTKADEKGFKHRRWQDVAKCSAMLLETPQENEDESTNKEKLMRCLGLEHLLARDIFQKSKEVVMAREHHRNVVLNVQQFQRRHHIYSPEDLATMAKTSSREARKRAHRNALNMGSL